MEKEIFKNLNLEIKEIKLHQLSVNGTGKSTVLDVICGLKILMKEK